MNRADKFPPSASNAQGRRPGGKGKGNPHTFARKVFHVSRLNDVATVTELAKQTGHAEEDWPLVTVKELADNALDAAEDARTAPEIEIVVTEDAIMVADRGPGIAPGTVEALVDYSSKTSSRAAYLGPTRGPGGGERGRYRPVLSRPRITGPRSSLC
jgi:hypothetical protein